MSTFLKPVVVLLVSILLFAGVYFLIDTELLDFIQTQFYNPSIEKSYVNENIKEAEIAQKFIFDLQEKFSQTLKDGAVRSSFLYNQSAQDIFNRSRIYGILLESTSGLQAVQFIDSNGIRIHYSTSSRDIISQSLTSTSYRNYTEDPQALPFELINVSANGEPKITMDENGDRIIFSFPFFDSMDVYRGTALFIVSVRAIAERLIAEEGVRFNDTISVVRDPPGLLFGVPESFKEDVINRVSAVWGNGYKDIVTLDAQESGTRFSLITYRGSRGLFFGRLVNNALFSISSPMKFILLLSMFLTFYLVLYFITNIRPHALTVVQNRIRRLRERLFEQLNNDKSTEEKIKWLLELEQRRDEIKTELKYRLKINKKSEEVINKLIDKSWDELIAIIRASSGHAALALKLADIQPIFVTQAKADAVDTVASIETIEDAEVLEELLDEAEDAEAATSVEEITEIEDAEAIEEIEDAEAIASVEEIDSIDDLEEVEAITAVTETAAVPDGIDEIITEIREISGEPIFEKMVTIVSGLFHRASEIRRRNRGLLKRASEIERRQHSLLKRASEIERKNRSLLKRASEIERRNHSLLKHASKYRGLLRRASDYKFKTEIPSGEGLLAKAELALASRIQGEHKGLYALASEIKAKHHHFVVIEVESEPVDEDEELAVELDIVSPFDSMFSSL